MIKHCEKCWAYYSTEHTCTNWFVALVQRYKAKQKEKEESKRPKFYIKKIK